MKEMMAMMAPVAQFHAEVENAAEDDIRMFWDVRIVRGKKGVSIAHTIGNSTIPGALSEKQIATAPTMVQSEVVEKIAVHLTAAIQKEAERKSAGAMQQLSERSSGRPQASASPSPASSLGRAIEEIGDEKEVSDVGD